MTDDAKMGYRATCDDCGGGISMAAQYCQWCGSPQSPKATEDGRPTPFVERVFAFNQQFDYGEYHDDPEFWLSILGHQADEAWTALGAGDEAHAYREAADAVLVAFQFMRSCGDAPPHHYVYERMANAEERGIEDEIVPKYVEWWEERSSNSQLRRFENKAQLLRHIAAETGADIDTLWDEYDEQVE